MFLKEEKNKKVDTMSEWESTWIFKNSSLLFIASTQMEQTQGYKNGKRTMVASRSVKQRQLKHKRVAQKGSPLFFSWVFKKANTEKNTRKQMGLGLWAEKVEEATTMLSLKMWER